MQSGWGDAASLLAAVRHHTQSARARVDTGDKFARMDAVLHAGSAVELICKLILLKKNTLLLHQATPLVVLASVAPQHPIHRNRRSIDANGARDLVATLHPTLVPFKSDAKRASDRRNDIVHMAIEDPDPAGTVEAMERFVAACLPVVQEDPADLFGVDRARQLKSEAAQRASQAKDIADHLIREARELYTKFTDGYNAEQKAEFDRFLVGINGVPHYDDGWEVDCPACGYEDAWLAQEAEVDQDFDGTFYSGMRILGLDCPRCRLSLDDLQLDAIGFDTNDYREPDNYYDPRED